MAAPAAARQQLRLISATRFVVRSHMKGVPPSAHRSRSCIAHAQASPLDARPALASDASLENALDVTPCQHARTEAAFLPADLAKRLRGTFDSNFADSRALTPQRFCWDYWHVPGQYTQLRTPADEYFEEGDYRALEGALLEFGKERLGCIGLTPIWLSYYIDGCQQELHCDNVHGPWAFVLSLTRWEARKFSGGETMLLQDAALRFWEHFQADEVVERAQLMQLIEPRFNQLTLFDPRVPHGVREVRGVREPTEGRIVLHGWFVEPEMFVEGALTHEQAADAVGACTEAYGEALEDLPEATGTLVLRMHVTKSGAVDRTEFLTNTLVLRPWAAAPDEAEAGRARLQLEASRVFGSHIYPETDGPSVVTMPLIFD